MSQRQAEQKMKGKKDQHKAHFANKYLEGLYTEQYVR